MNLEQTADKLISKSNFLKKQSANCYSESYLKYREGLRKTFPDIHIESYSRNDNQNHLMNNDIEIFANILNTIIKALPDRQQFIMAKKMEGYSNRDIAEVINISKSQVYRDYNKAVNYIRNHKTVMDCVGISELINNKIYIE